MPIGFSDGTVYEDELEALASSHTVERAKLPEVSTRITVTPETSAADLTFADRYQPAIDEPLVNYEETAPAPEATIPSTGTQSSVDKLLGRGGDRYQTWPEKAVRAAIGAAALPGKVSQGLIPPDSIQAIEQAAELASLVTFGPAPVVKSMVDGTLGSFAGVASKTIDKTKLYKAQDLEMDGASVDDIWKETGFIRGVDKRWRYEISDADSKLKTENLELKITSQGDKDLVSIKPKDIVWKKSLDEPNGIPLKEILDHPELFKAYPELKDMRVDNLPENFYGGASAVFDTDTKTIYMSPMEKDKFRSVLMHEIQHEIQTKEGFARGGNEGMFKSPELVKAEENFNKVAKQTEEELITKYRFNSKFLNDMKYRIFYEEFYGKTADVLKEFKRNFPDVYDRLRNLVLSEKLLNDEAFKRFEKYKRLAGEVEARNVQTRLFNDPKYNRDVNPAETEDRARIIQILSE